MGGSTTSNTQSSQESTNEIPQWVSNAGEQNYAYAQQVAQQPLQQYQGQMVADVSPQTQQAWNTAASNANVGQGALATGQAALTNAAAFQPTSVTPNQLSSTNLSPYMNPYTQGVINSTLPIMQQNLGLQQNQQQNAANSANAFGGSRQAIQQGVTQAQGAMGMGQMAAQLNQANFGQAQQAAQQDINTNLQGQLANQNAAQQAVNSGIMAGNALTQNAAGQVNANNAAFLQQNTAGAEQSQQAQNDINAQMAKFQQAWSYPQQGLGMLESSLGMTPYDTATSGTSDSTTNTSTSPNFASIAQSGLQGLSSLGSLFGSDRRLKTDIKKVDTHPSGVGIYAYRYKGDPKSYPKVVGPMAEDVAKIAPHAVRPMGTKGRLAVDMNTLSAFTPPSSGGVSALAGGRAGATPPPSPGVAKGIGAMSAFSRRPSAGGPRVRGALSRG